MASSASSDTKQAPEEEGEKRGRLDEFLGEFRIIIPGLGALLGFQLTVAFSSGFEDLSLVSKVVHISGVSATSIAFTLLLMPAGYHRFSPDLEQSTWFIRFSQRSVGWGLLFLPFALGLSLYVQTVKTFGKPSLSIVVATVFLLFAFVAWWLVPYAAARKHGALGRD